MASQVSQHDGLVGQVLGHYRIAEKIGAGGMGEVFRAHDQHLDRDVAIKLLPAGALTDESERKRLRKEALALSKLNHPNIATIHDFDTQQGVDFLVMEYISGLTLNNLLSAGPLPEEQVVLLGTQLVRGLQAAHEHGVVHGDLKTANVRVTPDGWLKILDFGLARLNRPVGPDLSTASLSETRAFSGTLPYMAPEQLRGEKADIRTDIYGLGTVLYEMATGGRVFPQREGPNLVDAILHENPKPPGELNRHISAGLDAVVMKALEKDRARRYGSAAQVLQDLEQLSSPGSALLLRARGAAQFWRRLPHGKTIAMTLIALICVLAVVVWISRTTPALALAPRDYVLITDFENQTGDPVFDRSLGAALATSLDQSTHANVYSRARIRETLMHMERPNVERIDEALALEIAEREGLKAIVVPTISGIGENYRLAARIRAVASGRDLRTEVARANGKMKVLDALDELSTAVRRDLGESLQEISRTSRPLVEVTTQSLEALKQYSMAIEKHRAAEVEEAKTYYENALRIDPHFTAAQASLGMLHLDQTALGTPHFDANEGKRLLSEAVQHVSNLTDKEKYGILAFHAQWVLNDPEKAVQYYKTLLGIYPECPTTYNNLAWLYNRMGHYDEAIHAAREAIRLDPRMLIAYGNLGGIYLYHLGEVKSALAICQQALGMDPHNAWALDCVGWSYFGQGRWAEAQAAFEKAVTYNPRSTMYRYRLAHSHRLQGHYEQAVRALEPILTIDPSDTSAWYDLGVDYQLMGRPAEAHEQLERLRLRTEEDWKKDHKNADTAFTLASVLLRLGEKERGSAMARRGFAIDPSRHFEYATLLSLEHRKKEAIAQLQLALRNGFQNYVWIKVHPDLQFLHGDPQFEELLAQVLKGGG
jgi:tetratricopeptide (TPR) repeat protein/predicted Ser/Thr protein kinase